MVSISSHKERNFLVKSIVVLFFFFACYGSTVFTNPLAAQDSTATASTGGDAGLISQGEGVFNANCAQCHAFDKVVVGPILSGAIGRWPSKAALHTFIKYPQKVIDGGDAYAKGLYEKYKQYMPNHDHLSDADIDAVIAYIESDPKPKVEEVATTTTGTDGAETKASGLDEGTMTIVFGALVLILAIVLVILVLVIFALTSYLKRNEETLNESEKEVVNQKFDLFALLRSPAFIGIAAFVFSVLLLKQGFDFVYSVGIQQGYTPAQPVKFSHKLHAGNYEINCNYCHTGAYIGKSAHIPSVNICMNCHNAVKTESPEIKKLYSAIENNKPIEWIRVHNLPDLAYFNHSQHTVVGGIECQTCHGPIENMEVVTHFSSLTMGWCINCHRETVVQAEGNPYYDKLVEFHDKVKGGEMVVENIGGLECGRCHY